MNIRAIFLIIAAIINLASNAQELKVKSLNAKVDDLSARTHKRLDGNGLPCALFKVGVVAESPTFSGNVICDVEKKDGYYWVCMTAENPVSKKLQINSDVHLPLVVNFEDYLSEPITSGSTYILLITDENASVLRQTKKNYSYITISVSPKNAVVYIDDQLQEVNQDGIVFKNLAIGVHRYRVDASGYISKTSVFEVTNTKSDINVSLVSNMGLLASNFRKAKNILLIFNVLEVLKI